MHRNTNTLVAHFILKMFLCLCVLQIAAATAFAQSPTLTVTHSFGSGLDDGLNPKGKLVQASDGSLYGISVDPTNDTHSCRVFKVSTSGVFTSLALISFVNGGPTSGGLMKANDGNLYGSVAGGSTYGRGMVLKVVPSTGMVTILYSFSGAGDGSLPYGLLCQASDGNLYGCTNQSNGNTYGTIFRLTLSGQLTTLHTFAQTCEYCEGGLMQATDGNLYGTTAYGGSHLAGRVIKLTLSGSLTTVYNFQGNNDGAYPRSQLLQASDGCLYGTTYYTSFDGIDYDGYGTVFKLTTSGALTTVHTFLGSDGANPLGTLTQGADGDLYGTTDDWSINYGNNDGGSVFHMSTQGNLVKLFSLSHPSGGVIQASDGSFYGATVFGGDYSKGTIFGLHVY